MRLVGLGRVPRGMLACTPRSIALQHLASHPRGMPWPRPAATAPSGSVHARALAVCPQGPCCLHLGLDCFAHGGCQGLGLGCCLPTYLE
nr:hypothetical protein CFP56_74725 [Quercus suber]